MIVFLVLPPCRRAAARHHAAAMPSVIIDECTWRDAGAYQGYTNQPDCDNIVDTLTRHAQQLVAAGVDFVAVRTHKGNHQCWTEVVSAIMVAGVDYVRAPAY